MEWLKENWFKIACLVITLIIGFGYVNFLNTKEANRQNEESKRQTQAYLEADQKKESENKKYTADQKANCLAIYKTESEKWNNTTGWRYGEITDTCNIRYRENIPLTDAECEKKWTIDGSSDDFLWEKTLCKDGEFENVF